MLRMRAMRRVTTLILVVGLCGCATRPGPEVLEPVGTAPGARLVEVPVATTRARAEPPAHGYSNVRADTMSFEVFRISVPPEHEPATIDWPGRHPDPARSFATFGRHTIADLSAFRNNLAGRVGHEQTPLAIFVHGYNTNFQEALFRTAQMGADAGAEHAPVLFAWPSIGHPLGYFADRDAADYSRDHLVLLLTELVDDARIGKVLVIGHSMGARLVMEALRQLRLQGSDDVIARLDVVLAAPDIDMDVFRAQIDVIGALDPPIAVLVAPDDKALRLAARLGGGIPRLGQLDVNDQHAREIAHSAQFQVVDISSLPRSDARGHDRFVWLAALQRSDAGRGAARLAGAFVLESLALTNLLRPVDQ